MSGWSTVAVLLLAFAAGYFVCDWRYQREARVEAQRQLVIAESKPAAQVADERKLTAAVDTRERGKATARAGVSAAPALADVPLPDDLAVMLMAQAEATRAASQVPGGSVPRSGAATVQGR